MLTGIYEVKGYKVELKIDNKIYNKRTDSFIRQVDSDYYNFTLNNLEKEDIIFFKKEVVYFINDYLSFCDIVVDENNFDKIIKISNELYFEYDTDEDYEKVEDSQFELYNKNELELYTTKVKINITINGFNVNNEDLLKIFSKNILHRR